MVNIKNVLSVIFVIILRLKEWDEKVPAALKDLFEKIGDVEPRKTNPPPTEEEKANRPKAEVLLQPTDNCSIQEFFNDLCDRDFQTFSATSEVRENDVVLRFMLCPRDEVNWVDERPFELMHEACGAVCSMVIGLKVKVYNNQYAKTGRPMNKAERAISVNATNPLWSAKKARHQVVINDDGEVVAE